MPQLPRTIPEMALIFALVSLILLTLGIGLTPRVAVTLRSAALERVRNRAPPIRSIPPVDPQAFGAWSRVSQGDDHYSRTRAAHKRPSTFGGLTNTCPSVTVINVRPFVRQFLLYCLR
jgi:hypothetical protein